MSGVRTRKERTQIRAKSEAGGNEEPVVLVPGTASASTGEGVGEGHNNTLRISFDHEFGAGEM